MTRHTYQWLQSLVLDSSGFLSLYVGIGTRDILISDFKGLYLTLAISWACIPVQWRNIPTSGFKGLYSTLQWFPEVVDRCSDETFPPVASKDYTWLKRFPELVYWYSDAKHSYQWFQRLITYLAISWACRHIQWRETFLPEAIAVESAALLKDQGVKGAPKSTGINRTIQLPYGHPFLSLLTSTW